jgi:protein phosphatase 1 regulatory subunit 7
VSGMMCFVASFPHSSTPSDLANNKLKTMAGLKGLHHLRKLDLGANRIRVMDGDELSGLVNLEELWLGKNKIEKIEGLEALKKLRRLDVQSNRLTCVENLQSQQETLEELYLAHNAIDNAGASQPTGLALTFPNLSVLDLNRNQLTSTDPLVHLKSLDELWISGNLIASFDDVQSLTELDALSTIYLEYNECQKDPLYRKKLQELMPNLKQIDADLIGGLASHGLPSAPRGPALTEEERLQQLQEQIIERARAETERKGGLKK